MSRFRTSVLLAGCALALCGCLGGDRSEPARIEGEVLTVYASLPRHGVSRTVAAAVAAGQRRALADAGARAGGRRVRLVRLDSTEPGELRWDPGRVSANAERAADDPTTIAYLGELDYGASAVSLPVTNDAGILQVSPTDGLTSLTLTPPGRPRAGPERYYPSERRTFVRLVPNDLLQAEALLARARRAGARRLAVVFDHGIHGRELEGQLVTMARRDGPLPVSAREYRGALDEIPDLARSLAEARPDAVAYAGVAGPGGGRLLAAIDRRLPGVAVYASGGAFARDPAAPIPLAPERVEALAAVPPAARMPASGARTLRAIERAHGPALARPEALYGYESMRLALDAIDVGGPDRGAVARAALAVRVRESPIGRYGVRATGDVDVSTFAAYRLERGRFEFAGMVR